MTADISSMLAAVRFEDSSGIRGAAEALRDFVQHLSGLRTAVTDNIASREPMRDGDGEILASEVFGFRAHEDACWWQSPQLALSSPLTSACRIEAEPFWCNADGYRTRVRNPLLDALDMSDFRRRALTAAALVVPVHLPFGQIGAASFLSPDQDAHDLSQAFDLHSDTLAIVARAFVHCYFAVTARPRRDMTGTSLTKREVECLRWAAVGKTNDEIGLILGLQRSTVRFHIRAASRRLDAVNRDQTLFKAAQLGYLGMVR